MAYVNLVGLHVTNDHAYSLYRKEMTPILSKYDGSFGYDFKVSDVLKGSENINRVFTIIFPDEEVKKAFFNDTTYLKVRDTHFKSSVSDVYILNEFTT